MGCKYCTPSDHTYGSDVLIGTNSGMFTIMDDRLVFTALWEHDGSVRTQSETHIRYCPVCGRDLLMGLIVQPRYTHRPHQLDSINRP